jgi:hypothetical protein
VSRGLLSFLYGSPYIAYSYPALVQLFSISAGKSGVTITSSKLRGLQIYARPLGATTVILGMVVLAIGASWLSTSHPPFIQIASLIAIILTGVTRYFSIQTALTKGRFPVARMVIIGISTALGVLVIITFSLLVSVKR